MRRSTHFVVINALVRKILMFRLWVYTVLLIGGLVGCTTPPLHLTPVVDRPNMKKIYMDGKAVVFSIGEKSVLAVSGIVDKGELILVMVCLSRTESIDVIPENIGVWGYSIDGRPISLKVYPPDVYMAKRRNAQNWNLALQALSGALNAQRAGKSTSTTYGSYGETSFYAKTQTEDRAATDKALARRKKELQQTAERYARNNAATESGLLKAHTIFKDQIVGGIVIVKLHTQIYHKIVVAVPWVTEEPHQITFTR